MEKVDLQCPICGHCEVLKLRNAGIRVFCRECKKHLYVSQRADGSLVADTLFNGQRFNRSIKKAFGIR